MRIETERLLLRNYKMSDLCDFYNLMNQENVANRAGFYVVSDAKDAVNKLKFDVDNPLCFAIVDKQTDRVIGDIALVDMSLDTMNTYGIDKNSKVKEVQCCLSESFWGNGLMTEAMSAIVKVGIEELCLDAIVGACYSKNKASEKVQIKCGLIPYKTDRNYVWRETGETCKAILSKITKEQ